LKPNENIFDLFPDLKDLKASRRSEQAGNFFVFTDSKQKQDQTLSKSIQRKRENGDEIEETKDRANQETWIFETFYFEPYIYERIFEKTVPDLITTWVIAGFALHYEYEIFFSDPKIVKVKDFSIQVDLPSFARYSEVLKVDVNVFYYIADRIEEVKVVLTLISDDESSDGFMIMEKNGCEFQQSNEIEEITMSPNSRNVSSSFYIRLLKTGEIKFKFQATIKETEITAEVEKFLSIEPERMFRTETKLQLINLQSSKTFSTVLKLPITDKAIPDSIKVNGAIVSDFTGSSGMSVESLM
jgi:CD109 antigen